MSLFPNGGNKIPESMTKTWVYLIKSTQKVILRDTFKTVKNA